MYQAAKFANIGDLYVLVNSDESVRQLKGPGRPIRILEERIRDIANCLLAIKHNIYIEAFDTEEELEDIIYSFKPDLIVKGSDRPDVREICGHEDFPVVIVPRLPGISTTEMLKGKNGSQD